MSDDSPSYLLPTRIQVSKACRFVSKRVRLADNVPIRVLPSTPAAAITAATCVWPNLRLSLTLGDCPEAFQGYMTSLSGLHELSLRGLRECIPPSLPALGETVASLDGQTQPSTCFIVVSGRDPHAHAVDASAHTMGAYPHARRWNDQAHQPPCDLFPVCVQPSCIEHARHRDA